MGNAILISIYFSNKVVSFVLKLLWDFALLLKSHSINLKVGNKLKIVLFYLSTSQLKFNCDRLVLFHRWTII